MTVTEESWDEEGPAGIAPGPYSDYLKRPEWLRKRADILERDNCTCRKCQRQTNDLNVHHVIYFADRRLPWLYPDFMLITLCETCHSNEHQRMQLVDYKLASAFRAMGATNNDLESMARVLLELRVRHPDPAGWISILRACMEDESTLMRQIK